MTKTYNLQMLHVLSVASCICFVSETVEVSFHRDRQTFMLSRANGQRASSFCNDNGPYCFRSISVRSGGSTPYHSVQPVESDIKTLYIVLVTVDSVLVDHPSTDAEIHRVIDLASFDNHKS